MNNYIVVFLLGCMLISALLGNANLAMTLGYPLFAFIGYIYGKKD